MAPLSTSRASKPACSASSCSLSRACWRTCGLPCARPHDALNRQLDPCHALLRQFPVLLPSHVITSVEMHGGDVHMIPKRNQSLQSKDQRSSQSAVADEVDAQAAPQSCATPHERCRVSLSREDMSAIVAAAGKLAPATALQTALMTVKHISASTALNPPP